MISKLDSFKIGTNFKLCQSSTNKTTYLQRSKNLFFQFLRKKFSHVRLARGIEAVGGLKTGGGEVKKCSREINKKGEDNVGE